ncbi:hypothetical protein ElyMa_005595300 [Elysia marginata]|uniref:Uncharacterized protein n=1 Tax=Elysia marginata TaxID=1093978 RepID=A0AAV4F4K0_9GAST|nr:hypothetical protein ElyMa_005595300 [Elysia marginata]
MSCPVITPAWSPSESRPTPAGQTKHWHVRPGREANRSEAGLDALALSGQLVKIPAGSSVDHFSLRFTPAPPGQRGTRYRQRVISPPRRTKPMGQKIQED